MVGTKAGGLKAAATNIKNHGEDFYKRIGKIGGQNGNTGGFASNHELARTAGAKGGSRSRRGAGTPTKTIEANAKRIKELLEAGVSCVDIAKLFGVSKSSLYQWKKRNLNHE